MGRHGDAGLRIGAGVAARVGEWSFIETLRHLLFATDSWIGRVLLGAPNPWHPLDLPSVEIPPDAEVPYDRVARPSLDEVSALRAQRMEMVRTVVEGLTDQSMSARDPGRRAWLARTVELRGARLPALCILNEEWQHHLYAERDLDVLVERG